jgi:hypothetical protein
VPDLSNAHFLERGLYWSTLIYFGFVCLAAIASFLLAIFAGRLSFVKDGEIKLLQLSSSQAVAEAHAQVAHARHDQKRLESDVAQAQLHRERLRKDNLQLQLELERERVARLRLEERLAPRHILAGQRSTIRCGLAAFKGQKLSMILHPGDPELSAFAGEFKAALEEAGIVVNMTPALVFGKPEPGLSLDVGANRTQFATSLAKALLDAGVCSGPIAASESDNPDSLEITVGPKPSPPR